MRIAGGGKLHLDFIGYIFFIIFWKRKKFSASKIVYEMGIAGFVSLVANKLGEIEKIKNIVGEDEWSVILNALRKRVEKCVFD